jgi:hypothetical protein
MSTKIKVGFGTDHKIYPVPRSWYLVYTLFAKIVNLIAGICISKYVYDECLFKNDCNLIATAYFCMLGLTCFVNFGLPVYKVSNFKSFTE